MTQKRKSIETTGSWDNTEYQSQCKTWRGKQTWQRYSLVLWHGRRGKLATSHADSSKTSELKEVWTVFASKLIRKLKGESRFGLQTKPNITQSHSDSSTTSQSQQSHGTSCPAELVCCLGSTLLWNAAGGCGLMTKQRGGSGGGVRPCIWMQFNPGVTSLSHCEIGKQKILPWKRSTSCG